MTMMIVRRTTTRPSPSRNQRDVEMNILRWFVPALLPQRGSPTAEDKRVKVQKPRLRTHAKFQGPLHPSCSLQRILLIS